MGLTDEEEDKMLKNHLEVEPIAELDMGNIPNWRNVTRSKAWGNKCSQPRKSIGVASPNEDQMEVYFAHFHATKEGLMDVYEEPTKEQVKGSTIWDGI